MGQKNDESVRNALFGATFGPGLLPPGEASSRLEKAMGKIFKPRGASQPLGSALAELSAVRSEIRKLREELSGYDEIADKLRKQRQVLAELENRRHELDRERKTQERRLGNYQQWEQWRNLKSRIQQIGDIPRDFPEDAQTRLAQLRGDCSACERDFASAVETSRQMEKRVGELVTNGPLAAELPVLRQLAERKSGYRQAISQLDSLRQDCEKAKDSLEAGLAMLGPGWDCQRIRQTDRSLFAREDMEKLAGEMNSAILAHQAAMDGLNQANRDTERANEYVAQAEKALADIPDVESSIPENERELLRSAMARLDESRRVAPGRQRAVENAKLAFGRAMRQAQIVDGQVTGEEEKAKLLNRLLEHQDEAERLAAEIQDSLKAAEEAAKAVEQAEKEEERIQRKLDDLRASQRLDGGATREALETKTNALRSLRALAANAASEEERKKELEQRINQCNAPQSVKNWVLIIFAIFFLAAAAGIFCAHWFWHIQEFTFGNGLSLPINLWASYAALLCGVILFASGFSAYSPDQKRRKEELARLLSRSETCSMHLAEIASQTQRLCETVGIDNLDPLAMDAMEMLLEREKEQLFHDERSARDMENLRLEREEAANKAQLLREERQQRDNAVQNVRRRWHGLMQQLNVANVPSPESVGTVFARVEAARIANENVLIAQRELDAVWEDLHQLEAEITAIPAIQNYMQNSGRSMSLEEAVAGVLENCKEYDRLLDEKSRCQAELANFRKERERAAARQGEAFTLLEQNGKRLSEARNAWAANMEKLGLAPDLDPETMRQAYKCMEDCLGAEDRLARARQELARAEAEKQALEEPLKRVLARLQREVKADSELGPDWLLTLDELMEAARQNALVTERLVDLRQAIARQQDRVAGLEAALTAARTALNDFIAKGGTDNENEFLAIAAMREEKRELAARLADMELILGQAAQGEPLSSFLESFESLSRQEMQTQLDKTLNEIAVATNSEQQAATAIGKLEAQSNSSASADKYSELRQKEAMLLESIGRLVREWRELALAKELLRVARDSFEKERQPEIIKLASEIFANITGGRWRGLSVNLEDSSIIVLPEHGQPALPVNLSRGAQEQAYLALRLAYIRQHALRVEPLPVIMDEILVNFDPERAEKTAKALAGMTINGGQQLLYFTCHPYIVELLQSAFDDAKLFHLENGTINAVAV